MQNSMLSISEKRSQRAAFEQGLDAYLAEVKASIMVNYDQNPQALLDPYTMLGRLEKETFDVKLAMCERNASQFKREVHEVVIFGAHCAINSQHVRSADLI